MMGSHHQPCAILAQAPNSPIVCVRFSKRNLQVCRVASKRLRADPPFGQCWGGTSRPASIFHTSCIRSRLCWTRINNSRRTHSSFALFSLCVFHMKRWVASVLADRPDTFLLKLHKLLRRYGLKARQQFRCDRRSSFTAITCVLCRAVCIWPDCAKKIWKA